VLLCVLLSLSAALSFCCCALSVSSIIIVSICCSVTVSGRYSFPQKRSWLEKNLNIYFGRIIILKPFFIIYTRRKIEIAMARLLRSGGANDIDLEEGACLWSQRDAGCVNCVLRLTDGRLVSGSGDGVLRLWDMSSGTCMSTLTGHMGMVGCVLQLTDGRLVSGSFDRTLKLWDVSSGACQSTLRGHKGYVRCVLQLSDGRLVSGSSDETLRLWDVSSGTCLSTLRGHTGSVYCVLQLSDGRLVSGSDDAILILWDVSSVSNQSRFWRALILWNVSSGTCLSTLRGHTRSVSCVFELSDGRLVSGSFDCTLRLWNVSSGACLLTLRGHTRGVYCVLQQSDGRLVSGSSDHTLRLWDVSSGTCLSTLRGHTDHVNCLLQLADDVLVSGSGDRTLRFWNTKSTAQQRWERRCGLLFLVQAVFVLTSTCENTTDSIVLRRNDVDRQKQLFRLLCAYMNLPEDDARPAEALVNSLFLILSQEGLVRIIAAYL
jgi:WD40 repeat protein